MSLACRCSLTAPGRCVAGFPSGPRVGVGVGICRSTELIIDSESMKSGSSIPRSVASNVSNRDRAIEDFVRANEGLWQEEVLEKLVNITGKTDRTGWDDLQRLRNRTLKIVPFGRANRIFSLPYWERMEQRTYDARVAHTEGLKPLLGTFRRQVPGVDELGPHTIGVGATPSPARGGRMPYDGKVPLPFEEEPLFEDLLYHLRLSALPTDPYEAWNEFKKRAGEFAAVREPLWTACAETVRNAFPAGRDSRGVSATEGCMDLVYRHAFAIAGGNPSDVESIRKREGKVSRVLKGKRTIGYEYWWGATCVASWRPGREMSPSLRAKLVVERLARAFGATETQEMHAIATEVNTRLKNLRAVRQSLVRSLELALPVKVFPGPCRFTGLAP